MCNECATWRNMAREKTGSIKKRDGRWIARVTYVGNDGKRKSIQKSHHSKPEAKKLLKEMLAKLDGITSVTYCRSYGFALWRGSL
jgi:hypothetical protein